MTVSRPPSGTGTVPAGQDAVVPQTVRTRNRRPAVTCYSAACAEIVSCYRAACAEIVSCYSLPVLR